MAACSMVCDSEWCMLHTLWYCTHAYRMVQHQQTGWHLHSHLPVVLRVTCCHAHVPCRWQLANLAYAMAGELAPADTEIKVGTATGMIT